VLTREFLPIAIPRKERFDVVRPVQPLSAHAHNIAAPNQLLAVEGACSGVGCQNCARLEIQQQLRNVALMEELCPPLLNLQRMLQLRDALSERFVFRLQLRYQHFVHESLLQLILAHSRLFLSDISEEIVFHQRFAAPRGWKAGIAPLAANLRFGIGGRSYAEIRVCR
jgi:hypothetical protein